jgi:hypothetical protein
VVGNYIMQSVGLRRQSGLVREVWHLRSNLCQSVPFWVSAGVCLTDARFGGLCGPFFGGVRHVKGGRPVARSQGRALRCVPHRPFISRTDFTF